MTVPQILLLYAPLAVLGAVAGVLHALAGRAPDPGRRRRLQIAWILCVVVGAPLWMFAAAALRLW